MSPYGSGRHREVSAEFHLVCHETLDPFFIGDHHDKPYGLDAYLETPGSSRYGNEIGTGPVTCGRISKQEKSFAVLPSHDQSGLDHRREDRNAPGFCKKTSHAPGIFLGGHFAQNRNSFVYAFLRRGGKGNGGTKNRKGDNDYEDIQDSGKPLACTHDDHSLY
jgi:hypothetical protein